MYYYVKVINMDGRMVEGVVKTGCNADFTADEYMEDVLRYLGISYNDDTLADWWVDECEVYEEEEEKEYTWWDAHEDEYMEEYFDRKYSRA
jgi:hypothetical protein